MAVDVTLRVPEDMMQLARKVAQDADVSVEAVLLDWIQHPITNPNSSDYSTHLNTLASDNDIQLWTVVHRHLKPEQQKHLDEIVEKHESGTILTDDEQQAWSELTERVETLMLFRSQALVLLKERGYDVSRFFNPQRKYE